MKKSNILMIIIIALVVSVCGYTIYRHFNYEIPDEIIPYSHYMDIIEDDNGYVAVGANNYYKEDSKYNKDIILQGDFIKFDKNLNIVKKVKYDDDNNGFMSREIIKVDDGYIVTGLIMPLNRTKSVVLKLDKDLNVVKKIYLNELDSTVAMRIVKDNNKYIVLTRTYRENGEAISEEYNVIFEIDNDLNIINRIPYKEDYMLNQLFLQGDNYLLIGKNESESVVVTVSKDTKEIISTKSINIPNQEDVYLYNNKLYTNKIVYDLSTDEFVNFSGESLVDNHILLIEDDIIYVSRTEENKESIYTYDLDMNKIKEYKDKIDDIDKLINYEDKFLIIGCETSDDDSIKPIIKFIEK